MMARIKCGEKSVEIADGNPVSKAARELGIILGCHDGICGLCKIDIMEGHDNLSRLSGSEEVWGMDHDRRLACQCRVRQGDIRIRP